MKESLNCEKQRSWLNTSKKNVLSHGAAGHISQSWNVLLSLLCMCPCSYVQDVNGRSVMQCLLPSKYYTQRKRDEAMHSLNSAAAPVRTDAPEFTSEVNMLVCSWWIFQSYFFQGEFVTSPARPVDGPIGRLLRKQLLGSKNSCLFSTWKSRLDTRWTRRRNRTWLTRASAAHTQTWMLKYSRPRTNKQTCTCNMQENTMRPVRFMC